jgi:hypothetical protein
VTYNVQVWSKVSRRRREVASAVNITTTDTTVDVSLQTQHNYTVSVTVVNSQGLASSAGHPSSDIDTSIPGILAPLAHLVHLVS